MSKEKLIDYLPEFTKELAKQIEEDDKRWGDTWKHRLRDGQELRIKARLDDYFAQFENAGVPIPWLKIATLALIAWIRENHPDYKD